MADRMRKIPQVLAVVLILTVLTGICQFPLGEKENDSEVMEAGSGSFIVYDNWGEFKDNWDLPYVDDKGFEVIKEMYAKVEFLGDFASGDKDSYGEYTAIFKQMLENKILIRNRETGEEIYFKDMENYYHEPISPREYYFFDMDEDGFPELGIRDSGTGDVYYLKYDKETKKGLLWQELGNWSVALGSRKTAWLWDGGKYIAFYQLDAEGETECETFGLSSWKNSDVSLHMVMLPVYADSGKNVKIEDWMKAQGVFEKAGQQWYFRVTEKQYAELMTYLWAANDLAESEMKKVTYTQEELFGEHNPADNASGNPKNFATDKEHMEEIENLPFVSDEVFETIRAAYGEIDFFGEFESGSLDVYDEYTEKFLELLDGKIPVVDRQTGEGQYIQDFEVFQSRYQPKDYQYSFFDVDGDGFPELGLRYDMHRFDGEYSLRDYQEYIFKYDSAEEEMILWHQGYGTAWTGTGKMQRRRLGELPRYVSWYGMSYYGRSYQPLEYGCNEFIQVDENGKDVCSVFSISHHNGIDGLFMVTMPQSEGFFRVTKKQYYELFACYEKAYSYAMSQEEDVLYTYEELHDWRAKYYPDPAVG